MKKILLVVAMAVSLTSCERITEKQVCEGDWQYMSDGTRAKCANDRLIDALQSTKSIHDTIYMEKINGEWHRVSEPKTVTAN